MADIDCELCGPEACTLNTAYVGDDDHAPPYIDRGGRDTRTSPPPVYRCPVCGDEGTAYMACHRADCADGR